MKIRLSVALISVIMMGCTPERQNADIAPAATVSNTPTVAASPTVEPTMTASVTAMMTATATQTASPSPTPIGCERPPDDYTRIPLYSDVTLNRRTITMIEHAQELYGGTHPFMSVLTQGSYNLGVTASFGTHDGGGAVDIAVRDVNDWNHVLYEEMDAIISALRRAGFAAWLRDVGDLYENSPVHIHAIAIGDAELSEAAAGQLMSDYGYFAGYNGLPENPQPDRHGGPIICEWMLEMGYSDLR
jgi:hypothetical protein